MKIALIGDFSGVHTSLKKGLEILGHETDLYSDGDGFKKIQSDASINHSYKNTMDKLRFYAFELPSVMKEISLQYDAIQIMNPNSIKSVQNSPLYYRYLMSKFKEFPGYKSLAVVGCEKNTQHTMAEMKRSPCGGCLKDEGFSTCIFINKNFSDITNLAVNFADVIIPFGAPSYAAAYKNHIKRSSLLPFPVDINLVEYTSNSVKRKIRILHGTNRGGFKGSDKIISTLLKIQTQYPDKFEIVTPERLPFKEYTKLLSTVNVVVDQLNGDGLGMNALLSMAAGCVVFTSFERLIKDELNLYDAPAYQIGETSDEIFEQLSNLAYWTAEDFETAGLKAKEYVESYCSPTQVASRVLEFWQLSKQQDI